MRPRDDKLFIAFSTRPRSSVPGCACLIRHSLAVPAATPYTAGVRVEPETVEMSTREMSILLMHSACADRNPTAAAAPSPLERAAQDLHSPGAVRYWTDYLKVRTMLSVLCSSLLCDDTAPTSPGRWRHARKLTRAGLPSLPPKQRHFLRHAAASCVHRSGPSSLCGLQQVVLHPKSVFQVPCVWRGVRSWTAGPTGMLRRPNF